MANMQMDESTVKFNLTMSYDEAVLLRELLWFTQLGSKGKGRVAFELSQAFDAAGFDIEQSPDWERELGGGKIIDLENDEVGIYWV